MPLTAFLASLWVLAFLLLWVFVDSPAAGFFVWTVIGLTVIGFLVMVLEAVGALAGLARLLFGRR